MNFEPFDQYYYEPELASSQHFQIKRQSGWLTNFNPATHNPMKYRIAGLLTGFSVRIGNNPTNALGKAITDMNFRELYVTPIGDKGSFWKVVSTLERIARFFKFKTQ